MGNSSASMVAILFRASCLEYVKADGTPLCAPANSAATAVAALWDRPSPN